MESWRYFQQMSMWVSCGKDFIASQLECFVKKVTYFYWFTSVVWQTDVDYWLLSYPGVGITYMHRTGRILDIFLTLIAFFPFNACLHLRFHSLTLQRKFSVRWIWQTQSFWVCSWWGWFSTTPNSIHYCRSYTSNSRLVYQFPELVLQSRRVNLTESIFWVS